MNNPVFGMLSAINIEFNPTTNNNTGEEDGGAGQGHMEGPGRGGAGEVEGGGLLRVPRGPLHVIVVIKVMVKGQNGQGQRSRWSSWTEEDQLGTGRDQVEDGCASVIDRAGSRFQMKDLMTQ